ncbi:MAG: hypothetical protein ACR2HL_00675 [Methylocystis sp.]
MAQDVERLYDEALNAAENYLKENPDTRRIVNIFLSKLSEMGYGVAPLEPTKEMLEAKDGSIGDHDRTVYRRMMSRRPQINLL